MGAPQPFRSITDARVELIQRPVRAAAFARMARAWGGTLLRPVNDARGFIGDPDAGDVAIGLYARLRCSLEEELTGLLVFRERPLLCGSPGQAIPGTLPDRLFVIEAMTVSTSMGAWRPSIPALLTATAASLIATVHHDDGFRTHVGVRVPCGDPVIEEAMAFIEAHEPLREVGPRCSLVAGVPDHELRFLDARGAARASRLVLDHLHGGLSPSQPPTAGTGGRTWQRRLMVRFPRPLRHLAEEMELVASGALDVGWSVPVVASNDTEGLDVAHAAGR